MIKLCPLFDGYALREFDADFSEVAEMRSRVAARRIEISACVFTWSFSLAGRLFSFCAKQRAAHAENCYRRWSRSATRLIRSPVPQSVSCQYAGVTYVFPTRAYTYSRRRRALYADRVFRPIRSGGFAPRSISL
jgi:hypothetical protein